jgi:hypothetical protein
MDLQGDIGQMEVDSVNLHIRWVHGFAPNMQQAQKSVWAHPMVLLGDVG